MTNSGSLSWVSVVCIDEVIGLLPVGLSLLVQGFGLKVKMESGNMLHETIVRLAQIGGLELVGLCAWRLNGIDGTSGDAGGNNTGNTDLY